MSLLARMTSLKTLTISGDRRHNLRQETTHIVMLSDYDQLVLQLLMLRVLLFDAFLYLPQSV